MIIFGINRLGVFGGGIKITEMKMNRKFNTFTDLKSLELEVLNICPCVPRRTLSRDGSTVLES
jgi:hypothetical protein